MEKRRAVIYIGESVFANEYRSITELNIEA